jgi:hypothetical protein
MGFGLATDSVKIYPLRPEASFRSCFEQILEFTVNMLDINDVFDVVAECTSLNTAQSLQIVSLLGKTAAIHDCFILESTRAAAAAAGTYTLTGTAVAPVLTFPGLGSSPTTASICMRLRLATDQIPVTYNV